MLKRSYNIIIDLSEDKKWRIPDGRRLGWHQEWLFTSFSKH